MPTSKNNSLVLKVYIRPINRGSTSALKSLGVSKFKRNLLMNSADKMYTAPFAKLPGGVLTFSWYPTTTPRASISTMPQADGVSAQNVSIVRRHSGGVDGGQLLDPVNSVDIGCHCV